MLVFATERLQVRTATAVDADLLYALWTNPRVMTFVGFPQGLRITLEEITVKLDMQDPAQVFDRYLMVELQATGEVIGECKLGYPDDEGIAETDVKLFPQFWGHKYGVEIKRGLVEYLFRHTGCTAVQASPNVKNVASIRMQEAVGGVRVGEELYEFPAEMQDFTVPVHACIYRVYRQDWLKTRNE